MNFLIYLLISTLGFTQLPVDYLNKQPSTILDEQITFVNDLVALQNQENTDPKSIEEITDKTIMLNTDNPYWVKITLKGQNDVDYKIKQGNSMLIIEFPENYLEQNILQKLSPIHFESVQNMEFCSINGCLYLFIEFSTNYPIRIYKDTVDSRLIHIDVARKLNPYRALVVIDPGHGGDDPGAVNGTLYEKDIVLDIASRLENRLRDAGIDVVFTRKIDESIDLKKRCEISNSIRPNAFISIHNNSNKSKNPRGISTYIFTPDGYQTEERYRLAKSLQKNLVQTFPNWRNLGILQDNFCVLRETEQPSALIEFGFISNPQEKIYLSSPDVREKAAEAIAKGIIEYVSQKSEAQN